tara:strand:- start:1185 stop:1427 length:243 start_codon:yes stop_codon:yes gene_type:complete
MKGFLKSVGKTAYNIKTAPVRAQAKVVGAVAGALPGKAAKAVSNVAMKVAKPLNKGGRVGLKKGGQPSYKHGEMHRCKPN